MVDLDAAGEALGGMTREHELLELVFDLGSGGVRDGKGTTEFDAGDALLGVCEVIDGGKG